MVPQGHTDMDALNTYASKDGKVTAKKINYSTKQELQICRLLNLIIKQAKSCQTLCPNSSEL